MDGAPVDRDRKSGFDPSGIDPEEWEELERQLEASIPVYDRVNRIMTLGQDRRWRRHVRTFASPGMKVLEVGCGPGSFAEDLIGVELTCLDPSAMMLQVATERVGRARASRGESEASFVEATAESIPLPDNSFDRVFCLFSFRDFHDKRRGLEEIMRVLKPGGVLVICDAGKGPWPHGMLGWIWMNTVVQVAARVVLRTWDHPFRWLAKTYTHYGTNGYYRRMLSEVGYEQVSGRLMWPFLMASRFKATKPDHLN